MKPNYARLRKCHRTLLRFVLGTLLMKLAPAVSILGLLSSLNLSIISVFSLEMY